LLGFPLSILIIGIFFRDSSKNLATGLQIGRDLTGKLNHIHRNTAPEYNAIMHKSTIFAKILDVNLND